MEFLIPMWLAASFLAAYVASEKQRSFWSWLVISLVLSPLLGLLALAALPGGGAALVANQKGPGWQGF